MRKSVFLAALLLVSLTGLAQTPTDADSLKAVRKLFAQRRGGGAAFTAIGVGATGAIIRGLAAGDSGGNAGGAIVGIAVLGGVPGGIGIGKLARFSKKREAEIIADYEAGKPIPPNIRRRLKRKHFVR